MACRELDSAAGLTLGGRFFEKKGRQRNGLAQTNAGIELQLSKLIFVLSKIRCRFILYVVTHLIAGRHEVHTAMEVEDDDHDDDHDDEDDTKPEWWFPAPNEIEVLVDGESRTLTYEQAFVLGCSLLEHGDVANATMIFERLEEFPDRGPRAFIMQAFCQAAALHFDECRQPLLEAFEADEQEIASCATQRIRVISRRHSE